MPIIIGPIVAGVAASIPEIAAVLTFVGLTAGAIGGSLGSWCHNHPGSSGCVSNRDIINTSHIPPIMTERADVGPCNVPMYNFDQCRDQVKEAVQVTSSNPTAGVAQFDNVPPACMDLVTVLSGSCTGDGPRPMPCGSACVQYTGLSDEQLAALSNTLGAKST